MNKKFILEILAAVGVAAISFLAGRASKRPSESVRVEQSVIVKRDTIREKDPVFLTKYVDRVELVPVTDTVRLTDTLWQAVEIERRVYQGDDYRAVVEGWRPQLAEIAVFPKTVYLQTEVTQQAPQPRVRFGFGATAGPAVIWTPDGIKGGAGLAAGLTIWF